MQYKLSTPAHPFRAIVLYGDQHEIQQVSLHSIHNGQLSEGRPLTYQALYRALNQLAQERKRAAYLTPANVLYYNPSSYTLIFYTPAMHKTHLYQLNHSNVRRGDVYPNPPLLWILRQRQMKLFALDSDERPTLQSQVYQAPYFNTQANGVCVGDMPLNPKPHPSIWESYVEAFFGSAFTHPTGTKNYNYPGSYTEMWQQAKELGHFPSTFLLPYAKLEDILQKEG